MAETAVDDLGGETDDAKPAEEDMTADDEAKTGDDEEPGDLDVANAKDMPADDEIGDADDTEISNPGYRGAEKANAEPELVTEPKPVKELAHENHPDPGDNNSYNSDLDEDVTTDEDGDAHGIMLPSAFIQRIGFYATAAAATSWISLLNRW
jgi:hypothetical protein